MSAQNVPAQAVGSPSSPAQKRDEEEPIALRFTRHRTLAPRAILAAQGRTNARFAATRVSREMNK